jgi:hypothetical protein
MNYSEQSAESPFAAGAGVASTPPAAQGDPYRALDDLMVAVEALCPVWPPRDIFRDGGRMLL